jgi:hypothetical protein
MGYRGLVNHGSPAASEHRKLAKKRLLWRIFGVAHNGGDQMTTKLLTTSAAADYLGVGKSSLEHWRLLPGVGPRFFRVGRHVRYRQGDLENFLDARVEVGGARRRRGRPTKAAQIAARPIAEINPQR